MKLFPFVGALILSIAPVQASPAFKEITKACKTSKETNNACDTMAIHFSTATLYELLCSYEHDTGETPELLSGKPRVFAKKESGTQIAKVAFNTAIEKVKKTYPNCSVKFFLSYRLLQEFADGVEPTTDALEERCSNPLSQSGRNDTFEGAPLGVPENLSNRRTCNCPNYALLQHLLSCGIK